MAPKKQQTRTTKATAPAAPAKRGRPATNLRTIFKDSIAKLGKVRFGKAEAKERAAQDEARRIGAVNILDPKQLASGKRWTPAGVLNETIGRRRSGVSTGEVIGDGYNKSVTLSREQLRGFKENIKTTQAVLRGGITAIETLDLATRIDKERASKEIKVSMPVRATGGRVEFLTNASLKYRETRHHVTVEFLSYQAAVAGGKSTPRKMAEWLRHEPLKFDCDCGRHTFWYRYITTIGGFNAGRPETGYPKVRNANLEGVACKHVVRTMVEINGSANVIQFLSKLIERGRDKEKPSDIAKTETKITQKQADEQAAKMFKKARAIPRADTVRAEKERQAMRRALDAAPAPKKTSALSRKVEAIKTDPKVQQQAAALGASLGLSAAQVLKLLGQAG